MPAATETYNGWSNYETWAANLWITGDQYKYQAMQRIIEAFDVPREQAEALEQYVVSDCAYPGGASMWTDLLQAAVERINWLEIVRNNRE